ncbi:hypothetical protein DTO027B5_6935 [Paecilomyces variotii]|nr:hypothetical protein DTO169C6_3099 [Paecilomyces variotii]KAJ9246658.1 hypothetical protein DTO207G8_8715 [Paecilomyces variotii]KAJ9265857.1 hypothetical protein DTO195F2_1459 [Paecilomyces variotii]KAJ9291429.1 hypothetical protein DTO021C3_786 [Paecilomyces variotii]KAJ9322499.1 hypothetical protein DTO027B3_6457 [Paecilomyces variotii]
MLSSSRKEPDAARKPLGDGDPTCYTIREIYAAGTEELSAATSSEPDFSDTCRRGKKKKITLGLQDQDVAVLPLAGLSWLLAMDT